MDRLKGNKLLALFEVDFNPSQLFRQNSIVFNFSKEGNTKWDFVDMKYHFSYDWQFKILEKIESLGFQYSVSHRHCSIRKAGKLIVIFNDMFPVQKMETTKEAIFRCCVKFVQWYIKNELKNNINLMEYAN